MFESKIDQALASTATALQFFKLSAMETRIYLRLLQLGPRTAGMVAKLCGVNRSYTYDVLASLVSKGLLYEFEQNNLKHYQCSAPQLLISALEQHEKEMAVQIEHLKRFAAEAKKTNGTISLDDSSLKSK